MNFSLYILSSYSHLKNFHVNFKKLNIHTKRCPLPCKKRVCLFKVLKCTLAPMAAAGSKFRRLEKVTREHKSEFCLLIQSVRGRQWLEEHFEGE